MAAPSTFALPLTDTTQATVSSRFATVLAWSAAAITLGPTLVPVGALHALSHVLEVRREAGPWRRSLVALLLGVALLVSGTGPMMRFDSTHDSSTAALELRVAERAVAVGEMRLLFKDGWTVSARTHVGPNP